jgi:Mn2+/Fe2+ NRAMP family transporter
LVCTHDQTKGQEKAMNPTLSWTAERQSVSLLLACLVLFYVVCSRANMMSPCRCWLVICDGSSRCGSDFWMYGDSQRWARVCEWVMCLWIISLCSLLVLL